MKILGPGRWATALACSLVGGLFGYSGDWWALPFAMAVLLGWGMASSRLMAFMVVFVYYLAASRGLFQGGAIFFASSLSPGSFSWGWGLFVLVVPSALLAGTWVACWGRRGIGYRAVIALLLVSLPPIGFLGWTNPMAGAGVWLPGTGWVGLALSLVAAALIARLGQIIGRAWGGAGNAFTRNEQLCAALCLLVSVGALAVYTSSPPARAPAGWVGIDTQVGRSDDYQAIRQVQQSVERAVEEGGRFILLPEAVGGSWELNHFYWKHVDQQLLNLDAAVLVGAEARLDEVRRTNGLFGLGAARGLEVAQRLPVPLGMWAPWSKSRHIVSDWTNSGIVDFGGHRAMVLICYEQFLVWPVLASVGYKPDVVLASANLWWASQTSLPAMQAATVRSWSRLFNMSVVQATNLSQ